MSFFFSFLVSLSVELCVCFSSCDVKGMIIFLSLDATGFLLLFLPVVT